MTTPITKEWLQQTIAEYEASRDEIPFGLETNSAMELEAFKIALAAMDAEPVGEFYHEARWGWYEISEGDKVPDNRRIPLYAAPPAPVVPDARCQHLSDLYHAQEKRLFKLAQRIKGPSFDKYAYSPSQAIDVLESAIFGDTSDASAAMLNHSENERGMVEPVSQPYKLSFDQWMSQQEGSIDVECGCVMTEVLFHWMRVAYEAGNSPVIPEGYVLVPKIVTPEISKAINEVGNRCTCGNYSQRLWDLLLVAAPQQEGE